MKHLFTFIMLLASCTTYAQLGLTAGYGSGKAKVSYSGQSETGDAEGSFNFGLFGDIKIGETVDLQPIVSYAIGEKVEGESNNAIGFGTNLQIYFSEEKRDFFVGPSIGYGISLGDIDTNISKRGVFSGGFLIGTDFSDQFSGYIGYSTTLSNPSKISGLKASAQAFGFALQYKIPGSKTE